MKTTVYQTGDFDVQTDVQLKYIEQYKRFMNFEHAMM